MARTKLKPPWKRWRGALPRVPGLQGPGFRRPLRRRLKGKTTVSWFRINGKEIPIAVAQPVALGPGPHEQVLGAHPDPDDVQPLVLTLILVYKPLLLLTPFCPATLSTFSGFTTA